MHYGQNDTAIAEHAGPFDFPIRDPLQTSLSWRRFQTDRHDFDEFRRWELAIRHLSGVDHRIHVIEELPVLEGSTGPHWTKDAFSQCDLQALQQLPEVRHLLKWMRGDVLDFFLTNYPRGFWWLEKARQSS